MVKERPLQGAKKSIIFVTSRRLVVAWQGTHHELMKLIIRTNVSCLDVYIHKSKETIVIFKKSKTNVTYSSMVLATNERMVN
jgi:hypothetical protein